jgi:hypothetical protein
MFILWGVALASLTWAGALLYWHFKLTAAIRSLEQDTVVQPDFVTGGYVGDYVAPKEARHTLMNAGCRSLPYLVRSFDPSQSPAYLSAASDLIVLHLSAPLPHGCDQSAWEKRLDDFRVRFCIDVSAAPKLRLEKCLRLKQWWREHGQEAHQWWRFWSRCCRE